MKGRTCRYRNIPSLAAHVVPPKRVPRPSWPLQPVASVHFGSMGSAEAGIRWGLVGIQKLTLFKRDGPLDAQLGVGKVHEG